MAGLDGVSLGVPSAVGRTECIAAFANMVFSNIVYMVQWSDPATAKGIRCGSWLSCRPHHTAAFCAAKCRG